MHRSSTQSVSYPLRSSGQVQHQHLGIGVADEGSCTASLEPYPRRLVLAFIVLTCSTLWAGIVKLLAALV